MGTVCKGVVAVCAVAIIIGFFLPWARVESKQVGSITKMLTGKRQEGIDAISGFKIPLMANSEESRLAITVIKIFNPGIENADKKSFLVWVIPVLAALIAILAFSLGSNKWTHLSFGVLGVAIFAVAMYKIITTDLDKLILQIKIGIGLWMIVWGYLFLGLAGLGKFALLLKKK